MRNEIIKLITVFSLVLAFSGFPNGLIANPGRNLATDRASSFQPSTITKTSGDRQTMPAGTSFDPIIITVDPAGL